MLENERLTETIEDLQFRALRCTKLYDPLEFENCKEPTNWIAVSSRYGICVLVGPQNKIYSCFCSDIHKLEAHSSADSELANIHSRQLVYHNPKAQIISIAVNCEGSVIAFAVNTSNGPFVEIFDVLSLAPNATQNQKLLPVASIRLSNENSAKFVEMQWNPVEPEMFAALTSDYTLNTFKCSLQMGSSFSVLGSLSACATCLCWSPKGKQLAIGDVSGKVHQLKPDLSAVRVVDPPAQIPIFDSSSNFPCVGLCWLSTTEWLVSHALDDSADLAPNIALLVVKKQQPPKWTHFGDVLSVSRKPITFCPVLDWQMVFVLSAASPSVAVFGLRGDKWLKFEFDTFDIEMPLTADNKDTLPLGIALDFSSTTPISIGEGSDQSIRSPPPFVHFLNSSGLLLPYAIVSLNNARPSLAKYATDKPPALGKAMEQLEKEGIGEKERMEKALKSGREKTLALERALEKSVAEYTEKRNEQTERIAQLGQLRHEVEKCASSLDTTGFLAELHAIKKELLQSLRQSISSLHRLCTDTHDKIEFLNGIKLSYLALKGGITSELSRPSFDMEKRLKLIEKNYESIMDKLKEVQKMVAEFEGRRTKRILRTTEDATIGPVEQRQIIQINENIAKMSAKLSSRLQQIHRSIGQDNAAHAFASSGKKLTQISVPLADFCALELEQLKFTSVDSDRQRLIAREATTDCHQFGNNLRDFLRNRPSYEVEVKRIYSLKMPDQPMTAQRVTVQSAEQKLAKRIAGAATSPPKPQLVSVGVQSPDFVVANQEKTPKRVASKKTSTTPVTTKTTSGRQSIRNAVPISSKPLFSCVPSSISSTKSAAETFPVVTTQADKSVVLDKGTEVTVPNQGTVLPDKVSLPVPTPSDAMALPAGTVSQSYANEKQSTEDEEKQAQKEAQPAEVKTERKGVTQSVTEEGMEDEVTDATKDEVVTFDFMKSGLGSSTPIDASRNPFGSMVPVQGSDTSGRSPFGTAPTSFGTPSGLSLFGTPSSKPTFGSLGVSPPVAGVSSSPFAASSFSSQPVTNSAFGGGFASAAPASSAFGGGASFGIASPFASAKPFSAGFGASSFGGGSMSAGGKSMFGGGIGTGGSATALGSGFSAFANKSAGFGQLANQQQQSPPSLFGGGPQSADTSFNQSKTSAFTTFRK